jgi:Bacterial transcriptional activator domain
LWRGQAAYELADGPVWLVARIAAMEEARLTALEQRIEADLATGGHRNLAAELAELTACHPLREQLRAHQMLALYRSGRQADALSAFHQLRRDLADELGIDPSPPLHVLYEAILRADPLIGWPPTPGMDLAALDPPDNQLLSMSANSGPGTPARPVQSHQPASQAEQSAGRMTPMPTGGTEVDPAESLVDVAPRAGHVTLGQQIAAEEARLFQGRHAELDRMLSLMTASARLPRIVQLHGPAGIGKTAFAHALARGCAARGWPAVILDSHDFHHDAAGLTGAMTARCTETWSPDCGRPLLLVLDTVEHMRDMEHQLWNAFLPRIAGPVLVMLSGRCSTPIFARPAAWQGLVDELELRGLPAAESRRLVQLHGVSNPHLLDEILAFGRGNPLFLIMAAQHAQSAGSRRLDLYGSVSRSLIGRMTSEIANPGVRGLLEAASLVSTFNQELLAAMLGHDVSGSFDTLCRLSTVRPVPAGLRLHDLVRDCVAADFRWRAPRACREMQQRAYLYLAQQARSAGDAAPYIQELLHLVSGLSAWARFYAPVGHPDVHVRPVSPDDLPRLTILCDTGITRFGIPPAERARQLHTDFPVAQQDFAVALDQAGAITGFAYTVRLNRDTWRTVAETREAFFAALPEAELAGIMATPAAASHSVMVTGATHLPGYDHVGPTLKESLFPGVLKHQALSGPYRAYHLLAPDCLERPVIAAAGLTIRAKDIRLEGWLADEWLLKLGDSGFIGWIGEILGIQRFGRGR